MEMLGGWSMIFNFVLNLRDPTDSMRKVLVNILLCFVLSLCGEGFASARADGYDKALDKYAYICERCVEMRDRARSGKGVSEESLRSMLEELAALRRTLSGASGRMSAAQLARFEEIKARYRQGMSSPDSDAVGRSGRRGFVPLPKIGEIPLPVAEPVEVSSTLRGWCASAGSVTGRTIVNGNGVTSTSSVTGKGVTSAGSVTGKGGTSTGSATGRSGASTSLEVSVLADAGIFPTPSYGAAAVVTWNGIGAYAGFRSSFRKNEYSYTCTSDGSTEYGRVWATGKVRQSRSVATAGFAMWVSRRFGFRLGAGLTSYARCWEDVSGQWAKVEDKSFNGLAADGGIFLTFKPFVFSVGVTSDFTGHADLQFGVGVRF